jgi:hypothetical protein
MNFVKGLTTVALGALLIADGADAANARLSLTQ